MEIHSSKNVGKCFSIRYEITNYLNSITGIGPATDPEEKVVEPTVPALVYCFLVLNLVIYKKQYN